MIKKHFFKDIENNIWDEFLRENFIDYLLFDSNYLNYENEYFESLNQSFYLTHNNEIALIKIYNSNNKVYFSQIYFSEKTKYDLATIKTITNQILTELFSNSKIKMHLKEYIHSLKSDVHFFYLNDKFNLNPIFELWVDLKVNEITLWNYLRSNYRNLIKKNNEHINIIFPENFEVKKYQNFHFKISGKKTRSDISWDFQKKMFQNNRLLVCEAYLNDEFIGFSFFNHTDYIAQYSNSVCERNFFNEYSVTHIMIWEALKKFRNKGLKNFYLGFTRGTKFNKTKVDSINLFKSGFTSQIKKSWLAENEGDEYFETGIFK